MIFNDSIISNSLLLSPQEQAMPSLDYSAVVAAFTAVAAAAAQASGNQGSLDPVTLARLAGQGSVAALRLSPELQVLRNLQARFAGESPPVTLMHNASALHGVTSLLSGRLPFRILLEAGTCKLCSRQRECRAA